MKCFIVLSAIVLFASAELYSSENDDLDIEAVLGDDQIRKTFIDCFNDKGPCDAVMKDFKKDMPEAVVEACAKCTDPQKHILKRFLEVVIVKNPEDYEVFKQKYDPQDKYFDALKTAIAKA